MLLSTESTKMQAAKVEAVSLKVATTYLGGGVPARKDIHSERKDFNMDSGFGRFYQWFLERNSGSILGSIVARVEVMCPAPIHMLMAKKAFNKTVFELCFYQSFLRNLQSSPAMSPLHKYSHGRCPLLVRELLPHIHN